MTTIRDEVKQSRILVVDDDPAILELISAILDSGGYESVETETDPYRVLIKHLMDPYDLILLDLMMPGMDGFSVIEQLRSCHPGPYLPLIVVTGRLDREAKIATLSAGAKDYLTKPIDAVEVLTRAENILTVSLLLKERDRRTQDLEDMVAARTKDLNQSRLQLVRCLSRAGEYRDPDTGLHIQRMSRYCEALALAAGWDPLLAESLLEASPMHDVGKIGIADSILLKPGKLDEAEMTEMRRHPEIGGAILQGGSLLLDMAQLVALTHHEKWDGSGYPLGLTGADIPVEGRIVAICDVFDALTTVRPYKLAWSLDDAFRYIRDQAGLHFDPQLAGLFESIRPQITAIWDEFRQGNSAAE